MALSLGESRPFRKTSHRTMSGPVSVVAWHFSQGVILWYHRGV